MKERLLRFPINISNHRNSNNSSHWESVDILLRCIQDHYKTTTTTTANNNTFISHSSKLIFLTSRRAWVMKKVTMKTTKSTWIRSHTTHWSSKRTIPSSAGISKHRLNSTLKLFMKLRKHPTQRDKHWLKQISLWSISTVRNSSKLISSSGRRLICCDHRGWNPITDQHCKLRYLRISRLWVLHWINLRMHSKPMKKLSILS